jgi:hypothetical protein
MKSLFLKSTISAEDEEFLKYTIYRLQVWSFKEEK